MKGIVADVIAGPHLENNLPRCSQGSPVNLVM